MDEIVLVNEQDEKTGTGDKMSVHKKGELHRALSVFVIDEDNKMLLQKRALSKYHSGGLWTNACCSHPKPKETVQAAAHRRLKEEMGFDCEITPFFTLRYKADVGQGLTENEYDHIYIGRYAGSITPNPDEVMDYKYAELDEIENELKNNPEHFTTWFRIAFPIFRKHLEAPTEGNIAHYSRS